MRRHASFIVHTQNLLHGSSPFSCKSLMQNSFMQDPKVIASSPTFGSDNSGVQTMHASGSEFLVENLHADGGISAIDDSSGFNCDVSSLAVRVFLVLLLVLFLKVILIVVCATLSIQMVILNLLLLYLLLILLFLL